MEKEHQTQTNISLSGDRPGQDETDGLFDSSQWEPCAAFNYNDTYFKKWLPPVWNTDGGYMTYEDGHIKPGHQLLYLEKGADGKVNDKVKAVDFEGLYFYAIETYELDNGKDGYTIHFRCRTTMAIYTLFYPNSLYDENQNVIKSSDYDDFAWKDITTEEELEQKKNGWNRIFNSRITKLTKLGF